ncbi:ESSS subunit of NADH:ubiquinone oxidoreductase-domain-containing protein [Aspergillus falconensis]
MPEMQGKKAAQRSARLGLAAWLHRPFAASEYRTPAHLVTPLRVIPHDPSERVSLGVHQLGHLSLPPFENNELQARPILREPAALCPTGVHNRHRLYRLVIKYKASFTYFRMIVRPLTHCLRARCIRRSPQNIQGFSTRSNLRGGADHGDHYDPPTGYLFGVKPGQKYVKEGWENIWYYGFIGSLLVAGVAYVFKPDTSIQTWALEEARRRLEAEGILEDPQRK